jgi:hypothetical protein
MAWTLNVEGWWSDGQWPDTPQADAHLYGLDADDNKVLERRDFELLAKRYAEHNAWPEDSEQSQNMHAFLKMSARGAATGSDSRRMFARPSPSWR